jgi:hypothetical protein
MSQESQSEQFLKLLIRTLSRNGCPGGVKVTAILRIGTRKDEREIGTGLYM